MTTATATAQQQPQRRPTIAPPSRLLMLAEGRALWEAGATLALWPLLQLAPRGDGHPVLVLPGLVASDESTRLLRRYLRGRGYEVHGWGLGRNLGPRAGVEDAMIARIETLYDQSGGRKVSLVGWSLGGVYARLLANRMPERVRSVITLGSPFTGNPRASNAWRVYEGVSGQARKIAAHEPRAPHPADAHHLDLQPHRRHRGLAMQRGPDRADLGKHRGAGEPCGHGRASGGAVCAGGSAGAA